MQSVLGKVTLGAALLLPSLGAMTKSSAAEDAAMMGRAAATQAVEFDVFLPLEHRAQLEALLDSLHDPASANFHHWLSPKEFDARFGVSAHKLQAIQKELQSRGLAVEQVAPRQLHVSGTVAQVDATFGGELKNGVYPNGKRTIAFGRPFVLPSTLQAADAVVAGLSGRVRMQPHAKRVAAAEIKADPQNRMSPTGAYWVTDLKEAYSFPSYQMYNGQGVTIGVVMEGSFLQSDMTRYFGHEAMQPPQVFEVKIAGGAPFGGDGSFETALDLQQTGGMAPKAQLVLYNVADLSDRNVLTALITAVESNATDVLSMSFGLPEKFYTPEYNGGQDFTGILAIYDDVFAQGNAQGITFVASSGDSGALAIPPLACFEPGATSACGSMQPDVQNPASSPHVTGVGGTNLVTTYAPGSFDSSYVSENAFADPAVGDFFFGTPATGAVWGSGGGESTLNKKPLYQRLVATGSKLRTVPDVSLHMGGCPGVAIFPCGPDRSYDFVVWGGGLYGVVGTSASAPDFAGLAALRIQRLGSRLGNENYDLYLRAAEQRLGLIPKVYREGIDGYNGLYSTKPGYDRVLGIGTVRGLGFVDVPPGTPAAGTPGTLSNP